MFILGVCVLMSLMSLVSPAQGQGQPSKTMQSINFKPQMEFIVTLPEPGYLKEDGSLMHFSEFGGTKLLYGTCEVDNEIKDLLGEGFIPSWRTWGRIAVPRQVMDICVIAVVMGKDNLPMVRSTSTRFTVLKPGDIPNKTESLTVR